MSATIFADRTEPAIRWNRSRQGDRIVYSCSFPERGCWAKIARLDSIDRRWSDAPSWARYEGTYHTSQVLTSTGHYFETLREAKNWLERKLEPWL